MDQVKSPCSGDCACCPRALANDAAGVEVAGAPAFA